MTESVLRVEDLVSDVVSGRDRAWPALWAALAPAVDLLIRRANVLGPLATSEDDRRNVALLVMQRLHEDGHRRLRSFAQARAARPELTLRAWLAVVVRRVAVDYLRAHDEFLDRRNGASAWAVRAVTTPTDSKLAGRRPAMTDEGTARQMLDFARDNFPADQRDALGAWMQGARFDDIATRLALGSPRDAERLVRAALQRLRRRFGDAAVPGDGAEE